jgi:hypothetical protein
MCAHGATSLVCVYVSMVHVHKEERGGLLTSTLINKCVLTVYTHIHNVFTHRQRLIQCIHTHQYTHFSCICTHTEYTQIHRVYTRTQTTAYTVHTHTPVYTHTQCIQTYIAYTHTHTHTHTSVHAPAIYIKRTTKTRTPTHILLAQPTTRTHSQHL